MKRIAVCVLFGIATSLGTVGCSEKTEVKTEKTVSTPEGRTTVTEEKEISKSGDPPPPNP